MFKRLFYLFALQVTLLNCTSSIAQEIKKEKKEIIIHEGSDSTQKMVIEVNGDRVMVNGKEVKGDEKNNLIIKKQKLPGSEKVTVQVHTIEGPKPKTAIIVNGETIEIDGLNEHKSQPNQRIIKRKIIQDGKVIEDSTVEIDESNNLSRKLHLDRVLEGHLDGPGMGIPKPQLGIQVTANKDGETEIVDVVPGSPAEKSGLKKGDIIISVDDKKIEGPKELSELLQTHKLGDKVSIDYKSNGKQSNVKASLFSPKMPLRAEQFGNPIEFGDPRIFDRFSTKEDFPGNFDINIMKAPKPKLGLQIEDTEDGNGVKVLDVLSDLPAAKCGLKKDDLIMTISGEKIKDVDQARNLLKGIQGVANLQVKRGNQQLNIELKVPKPLKRASL